MRNLFRFILQNHVVILFVVLEIFSFVLIFNYNNYQKVNFLNSSGRLTGKVYDSYSKAESFLRLPSVNRELAAENARLRELVGIIPGIRQIPDSLLKRGMDEPLEYTYIPARIISNSVNRQHNYFTLDKGSDDGVRPDMGIISINGVAGIVIYVSPSFSTGLSLLNTRWNVSAKLAKNNYFGSLLWDGKNYREALLTEIPFHVDVAVGDTVVTSGFSSFFPEGVMLGTVESFDKPGGESFYSIRVKISVDFKALSFVEVIENNKKPEIDAINKLNSDNERVD